VARVVVVGAGFAGASLIRNLPRALRSHDEVLLVDRAEEYSFIPLIHEVAVGRIHPDSVRSPIPPLCEGRCHFLRAEVSSVLLAERALETSAGRVNYEYLVLAAGSDAAPPPNSLSPHLQLFWTLEDALRLRATLRDAWNTAVGPSGAHQPRLGDLTVAIAGGGATGVELAAEVAALFQYLLKRSARRPAVEPRVVLLEAERRSIGWLPEYFHEGAIEQLERLGVEVRLNAPVREANEEGLRAGDEWVPARIRVWTAGIEISDLVKDLPGEHGPTGRVRVDEYLTLPEHDEVYVLGDGAIYEDPRHGPLPPTASVAVQQGPWTARDLSRRLRGRGAPRERPPFRFLNRGYVVSLGPESAVADALGIRLKGSAAQALYRGVLLYYLKSRRYRVLAASDWAMERTLGRVGFEAVSQQETPGYRP
jgi:NADH dehydrogenase